MNKDIFKGKKTKKDSIDQKQEFEKKLKRALWTVVTAFIVLFITIAGLTSFYTVSDKEVAVVTTFGAVTKVTEAGVHTKLPFGIQKVRRVEVSGIHKIELGYISVSGGTSTTVENESKMISGDFNIVNVDFFIEYKIVNPEKYLFSSDDPKTVLKMLAQSQIRNVIGSSNVDLVLTEGRENIEIAVKDLIINELQAYDIGVALYTIKIQDSEPPTDAVRAAFKAVETAKQDSETAENKALAYKALMMPKAEGEANKLEQNAKYLRQRRINEAKEEIAMFNAVFIEYSLNPDLTRTRKYYEAIETILPGIRLYIDTSDGDITKILPLESLINLGGN